MLQIGICDDDIHMLDYLSALCARILPDSRICACESAGQLLKQAEDCDIILMDVKLGEMDGLEAVRQLRSRESITRPTVIFITAYEGYVFDALDLFAFHYLLKPLDEEKFEKVLRAAAAGYEKTSNEKAIFLHTKTRHLRLYPSQITYVESNLRKAVIHTATEQIEIYSTMSELEKLLGHAFYRCHRGYLVNLAMITAYDRQSIRLSDGSRLLLAKPKYPEFVETYMDFLKRDFSCKF